MFVFISMLLTPLCPPYLFSYPNNLKLFIITSTVTPTSAKIAIARLLNPIIARNNKRNFTVNNRTTPMASISI